MQRFPHLDLAKSIWSRHLEVGDAAIDATCGNGHDTLFLAKFGLSSLFALDIQAAAIAKTRELLEEHLEEEELQRVVLCHLSHEDMRKVPIAQPPRLIVYNLGYLPGGDKNLTTQTASTLQSVASALSILGKRGAVSITCYPGHDEGKKEEEALLDFARTLPPHEWEVRHQRWLNRHRSPSLLWIARVGETQTSPCL